MSATTPQNLAAEVMAVQFLFNLIIFGLMMTWFVMPKLRNLPLERALIPLLLLHCFRHLGLMYFVSIVTDPRIPAEFANPTAYGDLLSAGLALATVAALYYQKRYSIALAWIFNVIGFLDLVSAFALAGKLRLLQYQLGPAWFIPAFVVPALIVTHLAMLWMLWRRRGIEG
jgi:hypothetical protein